MVIRLYDSNDFRIKNPCTIINSWFKPGFENPSPTYLFKPTKGKLDR